MKNLNRKRRKMQGGEEDKQLSGDTEHLQKSISKNIT